MTRGRYTYTRKETGQKEKGEETTEETSEKSEELEGKTRRI